MAFSRKLGSFAVDCGCLLSLVAIYPRFIEPKRLTITHLETTLGTLDNLTIVHLSDLHFHAGTNQKFLKKIIRRVRRQKPDLILFTGDFLCYSKLEERERLKNFLKEFSAPLGSFCTFGNHDYASYVSRTSQGDYALLPPVNPLYAVFKGLKTLFQKNRKGVVTSQASSIPLHEELCNLLKETPFTLLENTTVSLPIGLNIVGLGDYALGRCRPETAFAGYNKKYPGIVLSHNPDSLPLLLNYPGDWILSGHTHGEQIHLPFPLLRTLSRKLTRLENPHHSRGLYNLGHKKLYVNRGMGCHKPLRLFSPPEIAVIKVKRSA